MKKTRTILALATLALGTAAPAFAQFYIGGGAGRSMVNHGSYTRTGVTVSGLDSSESSLQINGGYQFNRTWGVELQYTDLGSRNGTACTGGVCRSTPDVKAYQWGIAGTATYDFAQTWFVRGKLGLSSNHLDSLSGTVNGTTYTNNGSSKQDLLVGFGIGHRWNRNVTTRVEYERFGKFALDNGSAEGTGSNIGLRFEYSFQ